MTWCLHGTKEANLNISLKKWLDVTIFFLKWAILTQNSYFFIYISSPKTATHTHNISFLSPHLLPSLSFLNFILFFSQKCINPSSSTTQPTNRHWWATTGRWLPLPISYSSISLYFSPFLTSPILFYFFFHFILIFHSPIPKHLHYHSLILSKFWNCLIEYIFVTRGLNFMEENEVQEDSKWDIELVINLFGQTFYFPLLFGFIFIDFCKYSFIYISIRCVQNWILNKPKILFK